MRHDKAFREAMEVWEREAAIAIKVGRVLTSEEIALVTYQACSD